MGKPLGCGRLLVHVLQFLPGPQVASRDSGEAKLAKSENYFRELWDLWWRERDEWREMVLPRSLWRFHGLRPANQPQRRVALADYWLASGDLPERLERWLNADEPTKTKPAALLKLLQVERDEFRY